MEIQNYFVNIKHVLFFYKRQYEQGTGTVYILSIRMKGNVSIDLQYDLEKDRNFDFESLKLIINAH